MYLNSAIALGLGTLATFAVASPIVKRDDGVSCNGDTGLLFAIQWTVVVNNDSKYDTEGCGAGFLDNFRGRCGVITDWTCNIGDDDSANMVFFTSDFCSANDITQAVSAATYDAVPALQCYLTGQA